MDNYDENVDELNETGSSNSINLKNVSKNTGKIIEAPKKIAQNTGKTVETTGKAVQNTGKAVQNTGKAVETTGKVAQKAGQVTQKAGQGIGKAGDSMMNAGKALSGSGYGAIAGVPLAVLGGLTKAAGVGTEIAGKGTEIAGKGAEAAGKGTQKAGEGIQKAGNSIDKAGQAITNGKKSIEKTVKSNKNLKKILAITGAIFPVILVIAIVLAAAIAALLPIFFITTMVGGKTVYGDSKNDVPSDLTINGIDNWSDEEKKIFDDLTKEKEYYDNGFSVYNATGIIANNSSVLDVSTPISTIHYQGTVNLTTFDDEYIQTFFGDGTSSTDYNNEKNVENKHTKDFYKQAGKKIGNSFMIYPGKRMLLGNMVKNNINFYVVEYDGTNSGAILSNWNLLGKITSSNEEDAKKSYSVSESIEKISSTIGYGEKKCDKNSNDWNVKNICYDTKLLYDEIFGEVIDDNSEQGIIKFLEETYEAHIPTNISKSDIGKNFIAVRVRKTIDYDLYGKYLKEIYIPYVYIDCDSCGNKDSSDEVKADYATKIYDEIIQLTNSFKNYNNEDYISGEGGITGVGGTGTIVGVSYQCGTNYISVSTDYCSTANCRAHNANDITIDASLPSPNIYPLMEGEVVAVNDTCNSLCPNYDALSYIAGANLNTLSDACQCGGGWGNYVRIKSNYEGKIIYSIYAHFSSVNVSVGDKVSYETVLGVMGTTGVSTGRHLHLELRYDSDYNKKFPATLLFTTETVANTTCSRRVTSEG